MITFKEGYLAKKLDILEYKFYEANRNEFQKSKDANLDGLIPDFHYAIVIFRQSLNQAQKQIEAAINQPIKTHKNELISLGYKNHSSAYLNVDCNNPNCDLKALSCSRSETVLDTSTINGPNELNTNSHDIKKPISNFRCQYYQTQNPYVESKEEKARKQKKKVKKDKKQIDKLLPLYDNEEVVAYVVDNAEDLVNEEKLIAQLNKKYRLHLTAENDRKTQLPDSDWKSLLINGKSSILDSLFVLQDDMSVKAGLSWPVSTLDVKVGTRTWRLNASKKKSERRGNRIARGPNGDFKFRVRAAVYLPEDSTTFMAVTREFTDCCNRNEVVSVLKSFFKYKEQIPLIIKKLETMKNSIIVLEEKYKVRFYSSSIVFMYNDQAVVDAGNVNSNKKKEIIECRLLDFEKAYVHIDEETNRLNIPLETCGDGVVDAFNNFIKLLKTF